MVRIVSRLIFAKANIIAIALSSLLALGIISNFTGESRHDSLVPASKMMTYQHSEPGREISNPFCSSSGVSTFSIAIQYLPGSDYLKHRALICDIVYQSFTRINHPPSFLLLLSPLQRYKLIQHLNHTSVPAP